MYSRSRGYLPHIVKREGIYFVTFRLFDSLPSVFLSNLKHELKLNVPDLQKDRERYFEYQKRIENYLDTSAGHCWLHRPEIASLVDGALRYFNKQRYVLNVWTIMPNHVHVILRLLGKFELSSIVHSWKSHTAHKANEMLKKEGRVLAARIL